MNFCICRDLRQPGARHHDAGGIDGVLIERVEACCVHGMCHGKIIGVDDEEFRIGRVAQAFRDVLGLRSYACRHDEQKPNCGRTFTQRHKEPRSVDESEPPFHRGMLPCFFFGFVSRLFSRARRAVMILARVSAGSMTASMYPRSAATKGLAKRSRNSAIFSWRRISRSDSRALSSSRL